MKLQEIGKLVNIAMPEGNQSIMSKEEQKAFTVLKARIIKRLAEENYQKIFAFKEYLVDRWVYIGKREMLMMKEWKDYNLGLKEAADIWEEVYGTGNQNA